MKFNEMEAIVTFLSTTQGNDTPEWQAAINNLQSLLEAMEPYEIEDEEGNYPPINQEEYQRIGALFDNTVASVNAFIKENNNNNDINDDIRIQLSKNLNKEFLSKAYIEFKNVKPNPNRSLHDSMENFRYQNVELSTDDLNKLGGNLSSRIQMTIDLDGKKTKGVFTKNTAYDPNKQYADLLDEMKLKYPKFDSFWDSMDSVEFMNNGFQSFVPSMFMNSEEAVVYDYNPEAKETAMNGIPVLTYMNNNPEVEEEFEKYKNDPDFFNALFDLSIKAEKFTTNVGVNEGFLGLEPGQGIDIRNSAMSSVANLLGVNDLIANSKNITVQMPDGSFENGTFMEFVESKDVTHLDSIDEMRVYGLDAYEGKEVKEQLANLQVLDYICGNVDRHLGNMLYKFDPETHKLASIKGIDNDASFFKKRLKKDEGLSQLTSIKKMRVIDEKMANKLLSIDEGMLGATLHGYGLNDAEINAAWDRLHDLQDAIKEASTFDPEKGLPPYQGGQDGPYGLTIVKSEDWDKLSLQQLKVGNNAFSKIIDVQKMLTSEDMVSLEMKQAVESSKRSVKTMLQPENTKSLLDRARSHKPIMGTSQRYLNVLAALQNYQNTPVAEDPLSEAGQAKWQSAEALKRAVDAYNQEKIAIGHFDRNGRPAREFSGKALGRIEDVEQIGKFVDKLMETKKQALDSQRTLDIATQKQAELNEFKSKSPQEQQAMLDQKHAQEAEKNQDLAVRLERSLANDDPFDLGNESLDDELAIDAVSVDLENN